MSPHCPVLTGLKHTCPSELAHKFLKQGSVSDGNSNADRLTLIATFSDVGGALINRNRLLRASYAFACISRIPNSLVALDSPVCW